MNRKLFALVSGIVFGVSAAAQAATYDNVYWVGGSGEWTGDLSPNTAVTPDYATGHWSTDPNALSGLPAKKVLGRNDGVRTNPAAGESQVAAGNYDLDRLPCDTAGNCQTTPAVSPVITGGTQQGTDVFIKTPVTVFYQANNQLLVGDDTLDRFGDFRFTSFEALPGTPTLNLSNGAVWYQETAAGGDIDGMWTRWNGAELNIDNAIFRRSADRANGFVGGAMMYGTFSGHPNMVHTSLITNGGRIENDGQFWFGVSGSNANTENPSNMRAVITINNGHMDLTGGDAYELDNDNLPMRADLAFVYDWTGDGDATNDEFEAINFTGPGTITVDGDEAAPLDGDTSLGGGGIRVAKNTAAAGPSNYGNDANIQRSYQDLWNMGILRANNKSGLTLDNFDDFFFTTNLPGQNNYKLTSKLASPAPNGLSKGDYNKNGTVDAADFVLYRSSLASTTNLTADGNQSLHIDLADNVHWRKNFGTTGLPTGIGSGGAVPEPGTFVLMIVGLASLWACKRRSK